MTRPISISSSRRRGARPASRPSEEPPAGATATTPFPASFPTSTRRCGPVSRTRTRGGNDFYYRQIRDDRYHLISAGPDGDLGNDDDVVTANSAFYKAAEIYARHPIEKGSR